MALTQRLMEGTLRENLAHDVFWSLAKGCALGAFSTYIHLTWYLPSLQKRNLRQAEGQSRRE
jgi:hypothetical protein